MEEENAINIINETLRSVGLVSKDPIAQSMKDGKALLRKDRIVQLMAWHLNIG